MNKCIFIARTTKDVELRYSTGNNATAIGKFSIAVDSGYGDNKKTSFFNMTAFGKTAETLEKFVKKGSKVALECEANQNQYTDKNGNKVNSVDFIVKSFEFCESKSQSQQSAPQSMPSNDNSWMDIPSGIEDSLPFN